MGPAAETEVDRVVIPGYTDLRGFSAAHEDLLKAAFWLERPQHALRGLGASGVDFPPEHQERLAQELLAEVGAGHTAPLMITNFPG